MKLGLRICVLAAVWTTPVRAGDWPMWRHDASRSAATAETLPGQLHLQWVRELPALTTAWPMEPRLHFDDCHHPVVVGRRLFVGSSLDGSLRAFDTHTGEQLWTFFANGPIRVAPLAHQDKVYCGSDDGYLYCLDAANGRRQWQVRGAPDERPEYFHLGNARLVSYWPVRGGPVLDGGTLYFAAGIWPSMGVFVTALDADSGKVKWCNRRCHYVQNVRIDHNDLLDVGLSPQGHLLISDGKLLVPNGRSMPAGFDPRTGELLYYLQGYRRGDARVAAAGRHVFVGDGAVIDTRDGREVGSRWLEAGAEAPKGFEARKSHLFESPLHDYKLFQACDCRSVFHAGLAYGFHKGVCYCFDLNQSKTSLFQSQFAGMPATPARWDAPTLWKLSTKLAPAATRSSVKAGNRLFAHVGRQLIGIQLPEGANQAALTWSHALDGDPAELLAADGKLFVVLTDGRICCFAGTPCQAKVHARETQVAKSPPDLWTRATAGLLKRSGVQEGYAVVLGLDHGRLVEELLQQSQLRVIAVDADAATVHKLRERLHPELHGFRLQILHAKANGLPPYLASLMVSEQTPRGPESLDWFRVLHPYGGAACLTLPSEDVADLSQRVTAAFPKQADVTRDGEHVLVRRAGAVPGAADWTHECADASRTFFSQDQAVKPPLAVLWYGDGPDHGFYKNKDYDRGVKPQVVSGRLFAFNDRAKRLSALDIYTGRLLWTHATATELVRFASMPDGIYVASGTQCDVLDPATGASRACWKYEVQSEKGGEPAAVDIRVADDVVLLAVGFNVAGGASYDAILKGLWDSTLLVALDRKTGKPLWRRSAKDRFNLHALALGHGLVFCTDSLSPALAAKRERRGEGAALPSLTIALEARTGTLRWEKTIAHEYRAMTSYLSQRASDDWLAFATEQNLVLLGKSNRMTALDAATGQERWSAKSGGLQPLILGSDSFANQHGQQFLLRTGQPSGKNLALKRGGCNYAVGNQHLLFMRGKCATWVDKEDGTQYTLRNLRSGCSNNLVAAGGLLNVPCFSAGCICNYPLQTSFSLVHMPEAGAWAGDTPLTLPGPARSK